jgi:hypothetical protein
MLPLPELQECPAARFRGRQSRTNVFGGLKREMSFDLRPQPLLILPRCRPGREPFQESLRSLISDSSALTAKNPAMMAAVCCQL